MCSRDNPCRLLMVEDDATLIDLFVTKNQRGQFLEFALDLTIARTLHEAKRIIESADLPFDVISVDLGLPDSQGPATYDAIRLLAPDVPIFIYTAGQMGENFHDVVVAHGAERYLFKTEWNPDQYLTLLHYGAGQHRARARRRRELEYYKERSEDQARQLNEIRNKITPESEGAKALDDFIANMKHAVAG